MVLEEEVQKVHSVFPSLNSLPQMLLWTCNIVDVEQLLRSWEGIFLTKSLRIDSSFVELVDGVPNCRSLCVSCPRFFGLDLLLVLLLYSQSHWKGKSMQRFRVKMNTRNRLLARAMTVMSFALSAIGHEQSSPPCIVFSLLRRHRAGDGAPHQGHGTVVWCMVCGRVSLLLLLPLL